ncbi:hypothetical protein KVR01_002260 [Diaporthe batatas]|uniref:uncharacterized protein n=1 Tax=Diaporthe batatas TaxID=748121 RepID=UPI001D038E0F|nr:uncharacterized protein KVR01_002260 [Diaporthe batatas]KAG8166571.1 hypothetical protein KVR01_002260 [Diaporthe batatas]
MADKKTRIDLIPWDFSSEEHQQRMYLQRVACGWRSDEIQRWVELGKAGQKTLYWVLLAEVLPARDREALSSQHTAEFPQESAPIVDTATTHWQKPRTPSNRAFIPIGHVALDLRPEENAHLKLTDEGIVWVAGLYISWVLHSRGFGREAMGMVESIASLEPLSAKCIVLDTMPKDQQMKPAFIEKVYTKQGIPKPAVPVQDWYEKQGYEVFARDVAAYKWENATTGETEDFDYLYLRKKLT